MGARPRGGWKKSGISKDVGAGLIRDTLVLLLDKGVTADAGQFDAESVRGITHNFAQGFFYMVGEPDGKGSHLKASITDLFGTTEVLALRSFFPSLVVALVDSDPQLEGALLAVKALTKSVSHQELGSFFGISGDQALKAIKAMSSDRGKYASRMTLASLLLEIAEALNAPLKLRDCGVDLTARTKKFRLNLKSLWGFKPNAR